MGGRFRRREQVLNSSSRHLNRMTGSGHVGNRQAEFRCTARQASGCRFKTRDAAQRMEQVVHLVSVVAALAPSRLGTDPVQARQRIPLRQRKIDVEERIPVAQPGLTAVMQAYRDLRAQVTRIGFAEPAPQATGDYREQDIIDGRWVVS
jgi:hypothetical protein